MTSEKRGSPPCGLYIRIKYYDDMQKTIGDLRQMALVINRASGYQKNMHAVELCYDKNAIEQINDLITICQSQGLVCIVSRLDAALYDQFPKTDGFVTDNIETYRKIKGAVSDKTIMGFQAGTEEGGVDKALALGVDYIILKADPSLLLSTRSKDDDVLLCASGKGITNDNVSSLALAGASFVNATDYIFNHKNGVMQGAVNMLHALDLAAEAKNLIKN